MFRNLLGGGGGRKTPSPEPGSNTDNQTTNIPPLGSYLFSHLAPEAYKKLEDEALAAPAKVKKRSFKIVGFKDPNNPRIGYIGCQGDGGIDQNKVANRMNEIANTDQAPEIIFCSGDIVYEHGLRSPLHHDMVSNFHKPYSLTPLRQIPWVCAPGNHDAKYHSQAFRSTNYSGRKAIAQMVAHSYVPDGETYKTVDDLIKLAQQDTIHIKDLNQFNMLQDYADYDLGPIQVFCVDSNHILTDYLNYMNDVGGVRTNPNVENQYKWLIEGVAKAKAAGKEVQIIQHHPLKTPGKRAKHPDSHHYVYEAEINAACDFLHIQHTKSLNDVIYHIYKQGNVIGKPKTPTEKRTKIFPAHDHFISIDDNEEFFQMIVGGGGGKLQECVSLKTHPEMKVHLRRHGFSVASGPLIDIYTTSPYSLLSRERTDKQIEVRYRFKYDTNQQRFITRTHDDDRVEKLRFMIQKISADFLDNLKAREHTKELDEKLKKEKEKAEAAQPYYFGKLFWNATSTTVSAFSSGYTKLMSYFTTDPDLEEIFCINDMKAYFQQYALTDFKTCLEYLTEVHAKLAQVELYRNSKSPAKNLFSDTLYYTFKSVFEDTLQNIYDKETTPIVRATGALKIS